MHRRRTLLLNLLIVFGHFIAFSQETGMQDEADSLHGLILKPDIFGIERPADMFRRNCADCHTAAIMYYTRYSQLWDTTFKSRDRFIHTWIKPDWDDTSGNIQLFAGGINVFNDTTPVKNAMISVSVKEDSEWTPLNSQILLTDDSGRATLQINEDFTAMTSGRYEILVKLVDDIVYPNGKYRFRMNWMPSETINPETVRKSPSGSGRIRITSPQGSLLIVAVGVIIVAIILFYFLYSRFLS